MQECMIGLENAGMNVSKLRELLHIDILPIGIFCRLELSTTIVHHTHVNVIMTLTLTQRCMGHSFPMRGFLFSNDFLRVSRLIVHNSFLFKIQNHKKKLEMRSKVVFQNSKGKLEIRKLL